MSLYYDSITTAHPMISWTYCPYNQIKKMQQKELYLYIVFFIFCHSILIGQINMIKYENKIVVDENEIRKAFSKEDDSLSLNDSSSIKLENMFVEFIKNKSGYNSTYYFNDTIVRYMDTDEKEDEVFYYINPIDASWTRYYTDRKGIIKYTETKYAPSDDWKLTYSIEVDRGDKKNILGYECYKVVIVENRKSISEGWEESCTYECYVTDDLNLPFNCTELIWEKVLNKTPLEIVYYLNHIPNSKEYKTAIEIKLDLPEDILKLPDYFKNAIKAN